jgi:hypothetical protein
MALLTRTKKKGVQGKAAEPAKIVDPNAFKVFKNGKRVTKRKGHVSVSLEPQFEEKEGIPVENEYSYIQGILSKI